MASKRFVATKVEVEGREETRIVEVPEFEPAPWTADTPLQVVGQCVPRMDALEKVTGQAIYTADVRRAGMLYAQIIRAPVAHGRVTLLDLAPALEVPGVRDVLTRDEVEGVRHDGGQLFDQSIRYAGQPLAAVCAETQEAADRAARAAIVRVDAHPHAVTVEQALQPNPPLVRSKGNTSKNSPRVAKRGEVDAGLRDADVVVRREYRTPVALHTAMEPHGAVAEWTADHVTVWESTQGIFNTRSDVAAAFGLKLTQVRVIKDYMGGGFGAKNGAAASTYVAVALSRKAGAPVRCVLTREAEQIDSGNRSSTTQRVTLGARRDGTLTAIVLEAEIAMGVGGWFAGPGKFYQEMYACPNVRTTETFVYTHTGAMASFRAPGHVEGAFGLESAMDALARELGIDPLELRRKNYATHDQEKERRYSEKRLDECYSRGASAFGWRTAPPAAGRAAPATPGRTAAPAARKTAEPTVLRPEGAASLRAEGTAPVRAEGAARFKRGQGMASIAWGAGGGPPAYATVRVNPDGTVDVLTGSQDLGTGARTVLAQIAAEALGARIEDVRTVLGDTERLPYTGNSWGSQTTASVGPAVRMAAEDARRKLLDAAAAMLDAPVESLEASGSVVSVRGGTRSTSDAGKGNAMSFSQIGDELGDIMILGQGSRGPNPDKTAMSAFAAQFAEVEVDVETGQVRVLRIVAAHDSGRIINPRLAESQLEGGILQGLGFALFEERVLDAALGVPLNPTMHDYKIPTLADLPVIEAFFVPGADTVANHTGAKGLAEPPIIGVAPAIANAVRDAIGAEILELPLTPWRVLEALARADAKA
jgi:xanthine dehydrogenase YagR molybdenum-binding subunit